MKLKSIIKTLTFFNTELIIISICMILSVSIGGFILYKNVDQTKIYTKEIKNNEIELKNFILDVSKFNKINNNLLDKSLQGDSNHIENDINKLIHYSKKLNINKDINSLILEKKFYLYKVALNDSIDFDSFKKYKYIASVNKYTEKKIFKKRITVYDTVYYAVPHIDGNIAQSEILKVEKKKEKVLKKIIDKNNKISNSIDVIVNKKLIEISKSNSETQEKYFDKINKNNKIYTIISILTIMLFISFLYLLIKDIRKKIRSEYRNKSVISILMKRSK